MAEKTATAASRFRAVTDEVITLVEGCSDSEWKMSSAGENWPLCAVAHHIAIVNPAFAGMVERFANGETYTPEVNMDEIHRSNAEHAREYANVGKDEVLEKLRAGGSAVEDALNQISDEQMENPAGVYGGNPLTVAQVIDYVVIGHTAEHLGSIKATLGA